jgi:ligand-binding SRPBCC domain-containing protein
MRQHFRTEQWLPYPLERVFAFFADPANLPRLMPPAQQARIDSATYVPPPPPPKPFPGCGAILAGNGTSLTITIRPIPLLPIRLPWVAVIENFRWLEGFCDVQTKGPFAYWRHCHTVIAQSRDGQPGTLVTDAIEYQPPLGPLGTLANTLFLRRQIASTFRLRHDRTIQLLPDSAVHL